MRTLISEMLTEIGYIYLLLDFEENGELVERVDKIHANLKLLERSCDKEVVK